MIFSTALLNVVFFSFRRRVFFLERIYFKGRKTIFMVSLYTVIVSNRIKLTQIKNICVAKPYFKINHIIFKKLNITDIGIKKIYIYNMLKISAAFKLRTTVVSIIKIMSINIFSVTLYLNNLKI